MRYLRLMGLSGVFSFALVWIWAAVMPMAYLDPEYPSWRAKHIMVARCDLGELAILGDSRAAVAILPDRLPVRAINLAVGGGEAIEALAQVRRMLSCPHRPRRAILSLDAGHFMEPDLFWERSVRYGLLDAVDLAELREATRRTGDYSVYHERPMPLVPGRLREWLVRSDFPALSFGSLTHGVGGLRWWRNQQILAETLASRGQYYFGLAAGSDAVALDGHLSGFTPSPILDDAFRRLLTLLDRQGVDTWFVAMPVNEATWIASSSSMRAQFAAYLRGYERLYPHFHVAADIMPHWPDRYFGDEFCHLNRDGAERFSVGLAQRLQAAPPSTQNDAQNGWLRDTGVEASFSEAPISKRGS